MLLAQIRDKFAAEQDTKPEETLPSSLPGVDSGVVDDRVAELARMLAGLGESDSGRAHARDLLDAARADREQPA